MLGVVSGRDGSVIRRIDPRDSATDVRRAGDVDGDGVPDVVVRFRHHLLLEWISGRTGETLHSRRTGR